MSFWRGELIKVVARLKELQPLDALLAFAANPTSANFRSLLTDETGTGSVVFGTSPVIATPTLTLKQSAAPTPTAEGDIQWDTDDNVLVIGDGAAQQIFVPLPASVAAGDMFYATGAKALARLAKGTALQHLRQNSALTAPEWATAREVLIANRTYYVRSDGSDSNNGLANTAGGAFLTIQKAVDVIAGTLDIAGFTVTIQIADATYTGAVTLKNVVGFASAGSLIIQGNNGTPANVVISTTSSSCFTASGLSAIWDIRDLKMQTTTSGDCIFVQNGANVRYQNVNFGACAGTHLNVQVGSKATATGNYAISGGAAVHLSSTYLSLVIVQGVTITITGTPAFSFAFATAQQNSMLAAATNTFSGSATGTRYNASSGGNIFVNGAGTTYFPGNAAGTGTNFGVSPFGLYA